MASPRRWATSAWPAARSGQTEPTPARAGALDELIASRALQDATVPGGRDDIQSRLDTLTTSYDVNDELARIKAKLPAPPPRRPWRDPVRRPSTGTTAEQAASWRAIPGESRP